MINLACVDLAPEVCTAVFGWRSVRGRQAVVHVLAVNDTSTLAREVHRRKVSGPCTVLKIKNKKKDFEMDEKLYYTMFRFVGILRNFSRGDIFLGFSGGKTLISSH